MKKYVLLSLILCLFFLGPTLPRVFAQTIKYEKDYQGNYKATYVAPDPTKTFPVTIESGATEATQLLNKALLQVLSDTTEDESAILRDIFTQLYKLKFTGDDLKVIFSNASLPVTQSGIWNIGSITTLPSITGAVTANIGLSLIHI